MTNLRKEVQACRAHLRRLKEEFARAAQPAGETERVKAALLHLGEMDQYVRAYINERSPNFCGKDLDQKTHRYKLPKGFGGDARERAFVEAMFPLWEKTDRECLAGLKDLMKTHAWFTIPEFGAEASQNAWLIAQHADPDPAFQRRVLGILEKLYPSGAVLGRDYAYLYDRVAVCYYDESRRQPQLYGTQGDEFPIADPKRLNARRAKLGLKPIQP